MKRYLIILACAAFIGGTVAPAMAVEKKEKSGTTQKVQPKPKTPTPPPPSKPPAKVAPKYDNFVDKNHNGIDDRKETTKIQDDQRAKVKPVAPKPAPPKAVEKKKDEKKPGR